MLIYLLKFGMFFMTNQILIDLTMQSISALVKVSFQFVCFAMHILFVQVLSLCTKILAQIQIETFFVGFHNDDLKYFDYETTICSKH